MPKYAININVIGNIDVEIEAPNEEAALDEVCKNPWAYLNPNEVFSAVGIGDMPYVIQEIKG